MPSPALIFMAVFFLESLAAVLQNGFIVTVLGREWVRCRMLPAGDMIVASLAASRFCLHGVAILNNLLTVFDFHSILDYFNILWTFFNTLSSWLTAWLAVFYCVKIAIFSHPVFFWLKWRISRSVPRLLLGSLLVAGLTVISSITGTVFLRQMTASESSQGNRTLAHRVQSYWRFSQPHAILLWLTPFLLFLVSTLLLMFSLHRHLGQMRDHRLGPRDPSTQAHITALKSLAFFLVFYTSYILSLIVVIVKITTFQGHWRWAWEVVTYTGICLHSSILVLSSPKLRKALKTRLWKALDKGRFISSYQFQ
ncbi:taste receptor type 2 member 134-like [Hyaena hyaena]|uniref:taste receptor type 2 member 134-like n=1 Tax=Hyaena hyaena TaxID=95912 RepID=UPI001921D519|nr:taste receptor type 2 member 134-like [Hyaena hyaena]